MPEINLLPNELRRKEKKEIETVQKKPKMVKVAMSSPEKSEIDQPLKAAKPGFFSKIFSKKTTKPRPLPEDPELVPDRVAPKKGRRSEKMVMHIPKMERSSGEPESMISGGSASVEKNNMKEESLDNDSVNFLDDEVTDVAREEKVVEESSDPEKVVGDQKRKGGFRLFGGRKNKKESRKNKKKNGDVENGDDESVLELNLIPAELSKYPELELPRRLFTSGLTIFIFILLVAGAYLGITWYQINIQRQINGLEEVITSVSSEIEKEEARKVRAEELQGRLKVIRALLDNHLYWSAFFDKLEENTLPSVYYVNFAMNGTESVVMSAIAKDYSTVAEQMVAFKEANDFIKSVEVSSASARISNEEGGFDGVDFNVFLEFQQGVFLKPIN